MQLACGRIHSVSVAKRPRAAAPARVQLRQAASAPTAGHLRGVRLWQLRAAAEDGAAAATADAAADSNGAADQSQELLSPLDRARQALEAEPIDASLMGELLAELEGEMFDLRDQLAQAAGAAAKAESLEGSLNSSKDQLLRLTADFENFRKRTADEKAELSSRAKGDVVLGLLPLVDNFELARTQVKAETEAEQKINNSYQGLYKQMVDIIKGLGVDAIDTVGAPFDPELHEAIMREPNDEVPDGTVIMEFRKGFKMGDRMLRPAMVKVSFSEAATEVSSADTDSEPASIDESAS